VISGGADCATATVEATSRTATPQWIEPCSWLALARERRKGNALERERSVG